MSVRHINGRPEPEPICPGCDESEQEIERLRAAMNKAHRALLGGSYKSQEGQMAKAENILREALEPE